MLLIAVLQIVTREKKAGSRIVIPPGSRFNTDDYPMIQAHEWDAMINGTPQVVRTLNDPAFVTPPGMMSAEPEQKEPEQEEPQRRGRGRRRKVADDDDDDDDDI